MLLLWFRSLLRFKLLINDELHIYVHPEYILLTHLQRKLSAGLKQKTIRQQVLSVDLSEPLNQSNALKNGLTETLNSEPWQLIIKRGIKAKVILSSYFVRYAIIPWSIELAVERERQAFMRYRFNALFGDAVKTWDLRMSEPDFGKPAIASGIDSILLITLQEVLTTASVKVNTISPYLMLAINQSVQQIKQQNLGSDFWFLVIESQRLCFALIENSAWRVLKNVAVEMDLNAQVNTLIQREMINCDVNDTLPIIMHQLASEADHPLKIANHQIIKIQSDDFEQNTTDHETAFNKWSELRV